MKKKITTVLALTLLLAAAALAAAEKTPEQSGANSPGPAPRRAVFQVENLTCGACFSRISTGLNSLEGFSGMGANLLRKMVAVDFIPPLTPDKIKEAITGLGYPASLDSVRILEEKEGFARMNSRGRGSGRGGCCGSAGPWPADCPEVGSYGCPRPGSSALDTDTDI